MAAAAAADKRVIECIDLNDSDDASSVLEILSPVKNKKNPAGAGAKSHGSDGDDNDDSDSDDDFLFQGGPVFSTNAATDAARQDDRQAAASQSANNAKRKLTKEEREEQRQRDKERREEERRLEKLRKQEERNRKRLEKEAAKQAEQDAKRRRILAAQQTMGKFASKEIAILIEPNLLQLIAGEMETLGETYAVHPYGSSHKGAIQWIRKDYSAGGAHDAIEAFQTGNELGYQLLDRMMLVFFEPKEFVQMLQRSDEDDDYPLLESWLDSLQYRGKLVLLLHQVTDEVNRQWNAHRRSRQDPPPPTDADLRDAIVWLLIQFQVECIECPTEETIVTHVRRMTRALSEDPYQQQVTELECTKKLKSECSDSSDSYTKANDTWIRQLQQVPRVSEPMARNVAQYFPTARSLWDAYQDGSRNDAEKRVLLAPLFSEGRQHRKLSETVYRLLTSKNPNEFL